MARVEGQGNYVGLGEGDQAAQFASILDALKGASPPDKGTEGLIDSIEAGTDGDNDKHITANELAQYMNIPVEQAEKFLTQFNTNTEGEKTPGLDATELDAGFKAAEEAKKGQNGEQPPQTGEGEQPPQTGEGEEGSGDKAAADLNKLMTSLIDADGDGKISPEELQAFIKKYDKNGDGQLDKKELAEGLKTEAKAKGGDLSDMQIDTILAQADSALTKANTDGKEGLGGEEFTKLLSTSADPES